MSGNYYILIEEEVAHFNKLNHAIIRFANLFLKISDERYAVVHKILEDLRSRPLDVVNHEHLNRLDWCVRNEYRLLDFIRPQLHSAKTFLNKFSSSAIHAWERESAHSGFFDKYFNNNEEKRAAKRLLEQTNFSTKLFDFFLDHLDKIELRLKQEQEFVKYGVSGSLGNLRDLWAAELKLVDEIEDHFSEIEVVLKNVRLLKAKIGLAFIPIAGLSFWSASQPSLPPELGGDFGPGWYALFGVIFSAISLYNLSLFLFQKHLSEEKKDIKLLKKVLVK